MFDETISKAIFGGLRDGERYLDAFSGVDRREEIKKNLVDYQKAQSISGMGSGTTDATLIPVYVDPKIVDQTRRRAPLTELLPRVVNLGKTADFNRLTARGIVGAKAEDAVLTEADDTESRASVSIKYFYEVGRVTGPALSASRPYLSQNYVDALNYEVQKKTLSLRYVEEDTILNGDVDNSRTAYGSVTTIAANEYDGIRNTESIQTTDNSGSAITIPLVRAIIKKARTANESSTLGQGDPSLCVTDFTTLDNVKGLLQEYQRYTTNMPLAFGMTALEFEGLPVIASQFMPTTSTAREWLALDMSTWQMRVMQDVTYEELAKTNDSYKFMLKVYEALICTSPEHNGRLYGLA